MRFTKVTPQCVCVCVCVCACTDTLPPTCMYRQTRRPPITTGEGGGGGEKKGGISQVDKQRMFAAMKTIPTISISEDDGTLHLET